MSDIACTRMEKRSARIPWGAFAIAFVFIFNPNVSVVDVLPDFLGYIILSLSLVKLSFVCDGLADARRAFERMILIDGAKILALLWVFGIEVSSERSSSMLLWSFVFGVLEIAFLMPAFCKLFDGLSELGNFHANTSIHGSRRVGGHSYTDKLKKLTVFFVIFKAVMALLPELADLTNASYDETSAFFDMYRYIGVMRGLCFVPVLIVGIVWLSRSICYFSRIKADTALTDSVERAYREKVIPKDGLFAIRNVKIATWFFVVSAILTIDFKIDGVNIFPDILVVGFMIFALLYFYKSTKISVMPCAVALGAYGISAVLCEFADTYFHNNYTYHAIDKSDEAFSWYIAYVASVAIKGILFVVMLVILVNLIRKIIVKHTGFVLGKEINSEGESKRIAEVHSDLTKGFIRIIDIAIVYVFSDVLCSLYGAFYAYMSKNMGWFSVLNIVIAIIFIAMSVRAVSDLREAVQTKYMLE